MINMATSKYADDAPPKEGEQPDRPAEDVEDFSSEGEIVEQPADFDVLLGRGRTYRYHEGNLRFQKLINANRNLYQDNRIQLGKWDVTMHIVEAVMKEGRFLKPYKEGKKWTVLPMEAARQKVAHAIQYQNRRHSKRANDAVSPRSVRENVVLDGFPREANKQYLPEDLSSVMLSQMSDHGNLPLYSARDLSLRQLAMDRSERFALYHPDASPSFAGHVMRGGVDDYAEATLRADHSMPPEPMVASESAAVKPKTSLAGLVPSSWDKMTEPGHWDTDQDSAHADDDYALAFSRPAQVSPEETKEFLMLEENCATQGGDAVGTGLTLGNDSSYRSHTAAPHFVTPSRTEQFLLQRQQHTHHLSSRLAADRDIAIAKQNQSLLRSMSMPGISSERPASPRLFFGSGLAAEEPTVRIEEPQRHYLSALYAPDLSTAKEQAGYDPRGDASELNNIYDSAETDEVMRAALWQGHRRHTMPHSRSSMLLPNTPPRSMLDQSERNAVSTPNFFTDAEREAHVTQLIEEYETRLFGLSQEAEANRQAMEALATMNSFHERSSNVDSPPVSTALWLLQQRAAAANTSYLHRDAHLARASSHDDGDGWYMN